MSVTPFAGLNPRPSAWGYNWTVQEPQPKPQLQPPPQAVVPCFSSPTCPSEQYANLPAALLSTLKREKKPFTYTPGGVNLSEVLNARLQKRIERKKRYGRGGEGQEPPRQVVVSPTYNTPLDMYSEENAVEALEAQAELVAHDRSLSVPSPVRSATLPRNHTFRFEEQDMDPGPKGVTQSKAFRVLQIITDTEEGEEEMRRNGHKDEMRFKSLRDSSAIPSKFFQTLQKITGTEESEENRSVVHPQPVDAPRPQSYPQQQQRPLQSDPSRPVLKRPAAFLPIKTSPGFRPGIHPPCLMANGRTSTGQPRNGGTDF